MCGIPRTGSVVLIPLIVTVVLAIVAFIGAAMWVGFTTIWENAESDIGDQIDSIGAGG